MSLTGRPADDPRSRRPTAARAGLGRWGPRLAAAAAAAVLALTATAGPGLAAEPAPPPAADAGDGGLFEQLVPGDHPGRFPTSAYDIGYDAGGWTEVPRKAAGFLTEVAFALVRWVVGVALWVVRWAFSFGFAAQLAPVGGHIAGLYEQRLVGPLQLRHLALFSAVAYGGWQILRSRLPQGLGEVGLSLLIAAVGAVALRDPAGLLDGALQTVSRLSGAVLEVAAGDPRPASDAVGAGGPPGADGLLAPLTASVHRAFVEDPYDVINWGRLLDGGCAAARDRVLADGPHGTDEAPRETMRAAGCLREAEFNTDPSADRLVAAVLTLTAAAITVVVLALVAATVVAAQLLGVGLVAVSPLALVGGMLPGGGRQLLWRWLAAGLRAAAAVVAMSLFLALLLLTLRALLEATQGRPLLERFGLLAVAAALLAAARRRLLRAGQAAAAGWGQRRETAPVGGTHGGAWMAPAAVGGATGFGVAQLRRDSADELREALGPATRRLRRVAGEARTRRRGRGAAAGPGVVVAAADGRPSRLARGGGLAKGASRLTARTAGTAAGGFVVSGPRAAARGYVAASAARDAVVAQLRQRRDRTAEAVALWRRRARHPIEGLREEVAAERARRQRSQASGRQAA